MRLRVLVGLGVGVAVGCSSQTMSTDAVVVSVAVDADVTVLTCPQTIAQFCAQPDPGPNVFAARCVAQLSSTRNDSRLCSGRSDDQTCGSYEVITVAGVDFGFRYYYGTSGGLIAVISYIVPGGESCVAGPASFALSSSTTCVDRGRLPACG